MSKKGAAWRPRFILLEILPLQKLKHLLRPAVCLGQD
jgi:hypothetical protein